MSLMFTAWLKMESSSVSSFIRTGHETTHWFQIRKGVCQGCMLSPCLFNLDAKYIMRNAGLDEAQAGKKIQFISVQFSCSVVSDSLDPMNLSMPGLTVHRQLPEFSQPHIHRVSDAIQPSHPQSSPSPPAPNPSQHQSLFQRVNP